MKNRRNTSSDRKRASRVALGGLLTGLGVVSMYLGSFIEVLDLTVAVIASLFCIVAVIEMNKKWALAIYAATAILSVLLIPNKFPAAVYLLFAGYYPILKEIVEGRIRLRAPAYAIKFAVFNVAFAAIAAVSVFILRLPVEKGVMLIALAVLGNITFVVYDFALTGLITTYIVRLRPRFSFLNKK